MPVWCKKCHTTLHATEKMCERFACKKKVVGGFVCTFCVSEFGEASLAFFIPEGTDGLPTVFGTLTDALKQIVNGKDYIEPSAVWTGLGEGWNYHDNRHSDLVVAVMKRLGFHSVHKVRAPGTVARKRYWVRGRVDPLNES